MTIDYNCILDVVAYVNNEKNNEIGIKMKYD